MELIDGLTLLYSSYFSNSFCRAIMYSFIIVGVIFTFVGIIYAIKEKDISWLTCLVIPVIAAGIVWGLYDSAVPFTEYHVLMDESVSYTEMVETYGKEHITHEGGNVYQITVYDKE